MKKQLQPLTDNADGLYQELSQLIEKSKRQAVSLVNKSLTMLFWHIGNRINHHILQNKRADYGSNFEEKNLRRMMQLAEQFIDAAIVGSLSRHLSWSHFLALLPLKKYEAKIFYAQMVAREQWGVRELRHQIEAKIFERKSLAAIQLRYENDAADLAFKDPYSWIFWS